MSYFISADDYKTLPEFSGVYNIKVIVIPDENGGVVQPVIVAPSGQIVAPAGSPIPAESIERFNRYGRR